MVDKPTDAQIDEAIEKIGWERKRINSYISNHRNKKLREK